MKNWTDNVSKFNAVACYVADTKSGIEDKTRIAWVVNFISGSAFPFKDDTGVYWKYSDPIIDL